MANLILVTGGARSGKSGYAQRLCETICESPVYLATAQKWDGDFEKRIKRHQTDRGECWTTVEETKELSKHAEKYKGKAVLIDCLTLWLTNFFLDEGMLNMPKEGEQATAGEDDGAAERALEKARAEFDATVAQWDATFVIVTNEIGSGVHPDQTMSRKFVDVMGWLNQHVGAAASRVVHVVCGQPSLLKSPEGPPRAPLPSSQALLHAALLDHVLSARSMPMEPEGYFMLGVDKEKKVLTASFYSCMVDDQGRVCDLEGNVIPCDDSCAGPSTPPMKTWTARTAKEMTVKIFERWEKCPVKRLEHAAYIGREMQRAEHCLLNGIEYQQD